MNAEHNLKAELPLLALLALLWGSSYLFIEIAVTEIPPITLIAIRVTSAAAFLLVVMMLQKETLPRDASTWWMLLLQQHRCMDGARLGSTVRRRGTCERSEFNLSDFRISFHRVGNAS